ARKPRTRSYCARACAKRAAKSLSSRTTSGVPARTASPTCAAICRMRAVTCAETTTRRRERTVPTASSTTGTIPRAAVVVAAGAGSPGGSPRRPGGTRAPPTSARKPIQRAAVRARGDISGADQPADGPARLDDRAVDVELCLDVRRARPRARRLGLEVAGHGGRAAAVLGGDEVERLFRRPHGLGGDGGARAGLVEAEVGCLDLARHREERPAILLGERVEGGASARDVRRPRPAVEKVHRQRDRDRPVAVAGREARLGVVA